MASKPQKYQVCADQSTVPTMYGVSCASGEKAERLTTNFAEIDRLVQSWNRCRLSTVHFWEAVEDFRHS